MNFNIVREYLKEYQTTKSHHNRPIGSVIKHHRRESNLTLEEVSQGICSVSYLCKVENNQIIPSERIKDLLVQELKIEEDRLVYNDCLNWIDEIISTNEVSTSIFNRSVGNLDYRSKLIRFAFEVLNNKEIDKSYQIYYDLSEYLEYLKIEEFNFLTYVLLNLLYTDHRYFEVIRLYNEMFLAPSSKNIRVSAKILLVKSLYKLEDYKEVNIILKELYQDIIEVNQIEKVMELKNFELATFAKTNTKESIEKTLTSYKSSLVNYDYIWFSYYYYYEMNFQKAYTKISRIKNNNPYFFVRYLIILDKLNKKDELANSIANPPFSNFHRSYKILINYLHTKHFENEHLLYLRKFLLYNKKVYQEVMLSTYLYSEAIKVFKNKHRYKESNMILEKENKLLKQRLLTRVSI